MRQSIAIAFVALAICAAVSEAIALEGFRPGKKHSSVSAPHASHHAAVKGHHHSALRDLEEAVNTAANSDNAELIEKMDKSIASAMSDMDTLKADLQSIKSMENELRTVMSHKVAKTESKSETKTETKTEQKAEVKAEEEEAAKVENAAEEDVKIDEPAIAPSTDAAVDDVLGSAPSSPSASELDAEADSAFNADDDNVDSSFLQLQNVNDDMNGGAEDDETSVPSLMMNRMKRHSLIQQKPGDLTGRTFGIAGDGSGATYDVMKDGTTYMPPVPDVPADQAKPNDVRYRVDSSDPSLKNVPVAEVDPSEVAVDSTAPGTGGKGWALKVGVNTADLDKDSVCVCKRKGAPRGQDRIRCKRHPTPTPTPVPPVAPEAPGVIQCTNGTWPFVENSIDSGVRDVICVYFPVRFPQPTPMPTPTPSPEDYPAECYDPRNEFVAEGVEKRPFDNILLQQGFEVCGC
jgi:hypothetical protein